MRITLRCLFDESRAEGGDGEVKIETRQGGVENEKEKRRLREENGCGEIR